MKMFIPTVALVRRPMGGLHTSTAQEIMA